MSYEEIEKLAKDAVSELIQTAALKKGDLLVIGCSTSEVGGGIIGQESSPDIAKALLKGILPVLKQNRVFLAAQCCEHLNRALIIEEEAAEKFGYIEVNVLPQPKAGGSFATAVWEAMEHPVAVEHVSAKAGLDIGGTLIGMHLREVAVPVRLTLSKIGEANLTAARTRPKFIGGSRACYQEDKL